MTVNIIGWIIFGIIISAIVKFLVWGDPAHGVLNTFLLGNGGAIIGGFLGHLLLRSKDENEARYGSLAMSIIGCVIIFLARYFGWIL